MIEKVVTGASRSTGMCEITTNAEAWVAEPASDGHLNVYLVYYLSLRDLCSSALIVVGHFKSVGAGWEYNGTRVGSLIATV